MICGIFAGLGLVASGPTITAHGGILGDEYHCAEHWLGVPAHMATAREAVPWTFGMNENDYTPTAEPETERLVAAGST